MNKPIRRVAFVAMVMFALLLGKPALTERDYEKAEELIVRMVLSALAPDAVV